MSYPLLVSHFQQIDHFNHALSILGWDQAAMMPSGGNDSRSDAMAALSAHVHRLSTAPQLADWLAAAEEHVTSPVEQASVREMRRVYLAATALPEDLVVAKAKAGAKCEHAWRSQRPANDWAGFLANWQSVVALSQQEAQARSAATGLAAYDAMLDLYEPGMTSARLDQVFGQMQQWLPELIQHAQARSLAQPALQPLQGPFAVAKQQALGQQFMQLLGFDFAHGRLDISSHPFCGGVPSDVRITTRYDNDNFLSALMGVIHETGHARYEQGLPQTYAGLPVAQARSMGWHESQSLFCEMQLALDPSFIALIAEQASNAFGAQPALSAANLQAQLQQVRAGYIRVDADEVTYPAHVLLRYEIERDLMSGRLAAADVPELWQQKMQQYLGLNTTGNYRDGCLQDIHWTDGSFGYFPSYTLGAMIAAQLRTAMCRELGPLAAHIERRDLSPIWQWLQQHVWSQASLLSSEQLLQQATGEALNSQYFRQHLQQRYLG